MSEIVAANQAPRKCHQNWRRDRALDYDPLVVSFAEAVIALRLPELPNPAALLSQMGERAHAPLHSMDVDRRAALAGQLVRLVGASIEASNALEQRLLVKLEAGPLPSRELPLGDSLTLISLRSHVRHILVFERLAFPELMRMQSAVANVARALLGKGYTRVRVVCDAKSHAVVFEGNAKFDVEANALVADALRSAEDAGYRVRKDGRIELRYSLRNE